MGKVEGVFYGGIPMQQHGFMRKRSTETAIVELRRTIGNMTGRYVIGIFIDMTGAFDRVWLPVVLS